MPKKSKSKSKPRINTAAEIGQRARELGKRQQREDHKRMLAVITEFGGKKKKPPWLTPDDKDPANDKVKVALANEILFLRTAMARLADAIALTQEGKPLVILGPGPLWRPRSKPKPAEVESTIARDFTRCV
jgi:hypothetical protein